MALKCDICDKTFSSRSSLGRHQREVHEIDEFRGYSYNNFANKCLEGCKVSFKLVDDLRSHLQTKHNFEMVCTELEFTSEDDFKSFLNNLVYTEKAQYVLSSSKRIILENNHYDKRYYLCNRSARNAAKPRITEKCTTSNETYIMNTTCTSQLVVSKCIETDFFNVTFFKTHYGHDLQLEHLHLTKVEKKHIALKLAKGVPPAKILDSYRSNIEIDKPERVDLITPRDINKIKYTFKVNVSDLLNVANGDENEDKADTDVDRDVIFYKKQNTEHPLLKCEDICIVLMNKSQEVMLRQFGSNIIAVDTSIYDTCLEVTTLSIVDEFMEGFPVTYMFSNRNDDTILEILFDVLKNKVGTIDCKNFITYHNTTTYRAWMKVMTTIETKHLFCCWFVRKDWKDNLKNLNIKKRDIIYKRLTALQQTLDARKFDENLAKEIQSMQMDDDTKEFANYFIANYSQSTEKWAYCHQESCVISNNLASHSDRIRKIFKNTYTEGENTICLDQAMQALMKLARDKTAERCIKLYKSNPSKHKQTTSERHQIALSAAYTVGVDDIFLVLTSDNTEYYLKRDNNHTCCNIKCSECNVCVQCFICSCSDFLNKHIICEHLHYIKMNVIFEDVHVDVPSQQQGQDIITSEETFMTSLESFED
ncbi:unnamed protein product [Phyllotreta striolata]|uniref:C2H2-type domain-containing protein n=1 Tax=Phyllotreta striolata TaxID=444603 RepID=A0A9N9TPK9_PHYSR|nr:unnamed protein product [Phyllotreta striolata]